MNAPQVSFVVPLYDESEAFGALRERLTAVLDKTDLAVEVVMVDDGSSDDTPLLMRELSLEDPRFQSVFLSRRFGHQLALTAGLNYANATEAVMIIDGDLQDPPELLEEFYSRFKEGYDAVYAIRKKREESLAKRTAYKMFYRILNRISYIDIPLDSGDFCLISRRLVDRLKEMPEESRYLRGMRSWIGFRQIGIEYDRQKRQHGESKYSLKQLFKLAYNGIFNFSEFPIKFIFRLGIVVITFSLLYFCYALYEKLFLDTAPQGFVTIIFMVALFGGVQLIALSLIGEYVLRIFFQVKNRPLFIVRKRIVRGEEVND